MRPRPSRPGKARLAIGTLDVADAASMRPRPSRPGKDQKGVSVWTLTWRFNEAPAQ